MYPTIVSNEVGVCLDDPKGRLLKKIREALKDRKPIYLVKKRSRNEIHQGKVS
jgi:hypothetical protein